MKSLAVLGLVALLTGLPIEFVADMASPFPWTLFAGGINRDQPGGILSEPGIKPAGGRGGCHNAHPTETEGGSWTITRANGDLWVLIAGIANGRWIGFKVGEDGKPTEVHWGSHDGDKILWGRTGPWTGQNYCQELFP